MTQASSLILRTVAGLLMALLVLFSVFLLLRGHHEPGGGFVGGLVAASAFAVHALAHDVATARRTLHVGPHVLVGMGLLIALASGLVGLAFGAPPFTGHWASVPVPGLGAVKVGTPMLFDIGVYLAVAGVSLVVLFHLGEEEEEARG